MVSFLLLKKVRTITINNRNKRNKNKIRTKKIKIVYRFACMDNSVANGNIKNLIVIMLKTKNVNLNITYCYLKLFRL